VAEQIGGSPRGEAGEEAKAISQAAAQGFTFGLSANQIRIGDRFHQSDCYSAAQAH